MNDNTKTAIQQAINKGEDIRNEIIQIEREYPDFFKDVPKGQELEYLEKITNDQTNLH